MNPPGAQQPEFDAVADDYDRLLNESLKLSGESKEYYLKGRVRWLHAFLENRKAEISSVLDFGCGTGSALRILRDVFHPAALYGSDVSMASIEIARKENPLPGLILGGMEIMKPGIADLAYCNGVFHHIPVAQRQEALALIYNSLKPGGYFALFENNPWNPGTRWVMSRCVFDRDAVTLSPRESCRRVEQAGMKVLCIRSLFYFPKAVKSLRALEPCLQFLPLGGQYVVMSQKPL